MKFKLSRSFSYLSLILTIAVISVGLVLFIQSKLPAENESQPTTQTTTTQSSSSSNETQIDTSDWLTYRNEEFGFEFKYPKDATLHGDRIYFPIPRGTTLSEKYLQIIIKNNISKEDCSNPLHTIIEKEKIVLINGRKFKEEIGTEYAAGNIYRSISYSTFKNNTCIGLVLILRSGNPEAFDILLNPYDEKKEIKIFETIITTFKW